MGKTRHVCGYLKDFLFDPKMVFHPVSALSGGQKNRLMLAKALANPGSLLILDEPTNDLDMDTLDKLEDILSKYTGTLLVVSHDRDFLDQTVSKILAFEGDGKVDAIIGGYQDYLAKRQAKGESQDASGVASRKNSTNRSTAKTRIPQKLSYAQQYEFDNLPAIIAALENEIAAIEPQLADPDLYSRDEKSFHRLSTRLVKAKKELATAEHRWLELDEMRASLMAPAN